MLKMNSAITQYSKNEALSNSISSTSSFYQIIGQSFNSPSKTKPVSLPETTGSLLDPNVGATSSRFDTDLTATRLLTPFLCV